MPRSMQGRSAFTLVELFVVLLVIGVAIGFILPALLASREAGRRVQCLNNMRQIALALQNYHERYRVLPPGSVNSSAPVHHRRDGLHIGWCVQLLPYVEQSGVAMQVDTRSSVYDPVNATAAVISLNFLKCPSGRGSATAAGLGVSSYAGCHHDVESPIDVNNHGVLYLNSRVRLEDVDDGTSTTLMLGEKRIEPSDLGWMSGTSATLRNTGTPINAPLPPEDEDRVGGFSSRHPGGANFVFCDGAVRFLRQQINEVVYRRLGHRADGELVNDNDL